MSPLRVGWSGVILATLLVGCSSRPALVQISGVVRFEGRPLAKGEIRFLPKPGTAAPANGARIVDGRYRVTARGGLLPGGYRVEIESGSTTGSEPAMPEPGAGPPQAPLAIPARYNVESTLEAEISGEPREQSLDYELTAKE